MTDTRSQHFFFLSFPCKEAHIRFRAALCIGENSLLSVPFAQRGSLSTFFLVSETEVDICWRFPGKPCFTDEREYICGSHTSILLSALTRTQYLDLRSSSYIHKGKPKNIADTISCCNKILN